MRICFYVNGNDWFQGSKDQFLKWIGRDSMPKNGDEIQFNWGDGVKSEVFKIIQVTESITGTTSIYSQIKFD